MNLDKFHELEPYGLNKTEKEKLLFEALQNLTRHHYENCEGYKKILDKLEINIDNLKNTFDIPFIPVRLFKEFELKSVADEDVFKTMTSSGTSGQAEPDVFGTA